MFMYFDVNKKDMAITKRDCVKSDVLYILNNLRDVEKEELKLLLGEDWFNISFKNITETKFFTIIGVLDDLPLGMGGAWCVDSSLKNAACVWLLTTKHITKYKKSLIKIVKKEIEKASYDFDFLYNVIYKKNFMMKKYLKKLGFTFDVSEIKDFELFYKNTTIKEEKHGRC